MNQSGDWENWCSEFAAKWPARMQAFLAKHPDFNDNGTVWRVSRREVDVPPAAVERLSQGAEWDISWLVADLRHERRRWVVARLAGLARSVPSALFEPMLIAAAAAEDPSLSRLFVDPCVATFGTDRVREFLISLAESSDPRTVVGAIDAMYWVSQRSQRHAIERRRTFLLEAFVSDRSSSYVRDRMDAFRLTLDEQLYPDTHKPLVVRAREIKAMVFRGPEAR
jgi:hypothetical protein